MSVRRLSLLCTCVLVPVSVAGQTPAPACNPMAPPAQVIQALRTLYGQVRVERGAAPTVRTYAAQLLRALAYRLALPSPLKLGVWSGGSYSRTDSASALPLDTGWIHPDLALGAYLVINRTGTLRRLVLAQTTLVPGLDSAVLAPLQAAVDTSVLPAALLEGDRDSVVLYFATSIRADSSRGLAGLDSGAVVQPLARVSLPHVRLQRGPQLVRGSAWLDYPRRAGLDIPADGKVLMEFTVSADGRVAPGSLRLRDGTSPEFVAEVYDATARMRFEPAKSGDCAIALVVDEIFRFRHSYIVR
ncbi:MAG TPA: hypothetical protein VGV12_08535 [Gemmatimonadales bacterium]|nr:hypothetical protein [Gemmatimonadales bacterium]